MIIGVRLPKLLSPLRTNLEFWNKPKRSAFLWERHILFYEHVQKISISNFSLVPLSSTPSSVQHTSSTKRATPFQPPKFAGSTKKALIQHTRQFNTKNREFHTKNPSVQHIPQFNTKKPSVQHTWCWPQHFGVELTDFGCWKGVIHVLNWCVELRSAHFSEIIFYCCNY